MEGWQPPREDINAPDLYIPSEHYTYERKMELIVVMALVTYTLLSALVSGLQSRFHPEVLGYSLSKAMLVVVGEFCAIKLGCYLLDVRGSGASGVELIGYGGYKFVGYVISSLPSSLSLLHRSSLVSCSCEGRDILQANESDIQDYRHCPTRLPKRRTFDFDTSIRLRILCKRLFLGKSKALIPKYIRSRRLQKGYG